MAHFGEKSPVGTHRIEIRLAYRPQFFIQTALMPVTPVTPDSLLIVEKEINN